ncbi:response regulator [Sulfurospirillum sp. T05]|uniref:Response regulator n=1 Tax=Sulfurospirillum tamanense TaxID=2813362 RepID=A0ABS2WU80_9BACT|nr:response regulator [Sulfurospirillum tamanensis]MBN2965207.1 response regulator [Sulfurospirillum tamanensis]
MELKTRVMLVEDEATAREILGFYLGTLFDEVLVAKDGKEGLETFLSHQPIDLILTDIRMPHMNGLEMIEAIKKHQEDQKFIVVSAHKEEELLLRSINLRVIGYFVKPLNIDTVMEILQKAKAEVLREKEKLLQNPARITLNATYVYDTNGGLLYHTDGTLIPLSKKELLLLQALLQHKGKILPVSTCKTLLWGDEEVSDATFRTLMKRLRDKISADDFILSRKGQGYIIA